MKSAAALFRWPWFAAGAVVVTLACVAAPSLLRRPADPTAVPEFVAVTKKIMVAPPPKSPPAYSPASLSGSVPASGSGSVPIAARRALQRSAEVSLFVDDVERAAGAVTGIAERAVGDVISLDDQRPASDRDAHVAEIKIEVASGQFDTVLARLARLGAVRSRTIDAEDVGNELVDDAARLRNLRRTERDIATIMDRSGRISEVLDAQSQLASVREEIEKLSSERAALAHRVNYATIAVHLESAIVPAPAEPSVLTRLDQARRAAAERFVDAFVSLAVLAFNVAVCLPYAGLGLAVVASGVALARRRRHT